VRRADNLATFMRRLSWNLGASNSWNPQGLSRPVMGLLYLYLLLTCRNEQIFTSLSRVRLWAKQVISIHFVRFELLVSMNIEGCCLLKCDIVRQKLPGSVRNLPLSLLACSRRLVVPSKHGKFLPDCMASHTRRQESWAFTWAVWL
jgi:hypothetical protein